MKIKSIDSIFWKQPGTLYDPVIDMDKPDRDRFLAERCRDETLRKNLEYMLEIRIRLVLQICNALEYADQNLVIHRDLKPAR